MNLSNTNRVRGLLTDVQNRMHMYFLSITFESACSFLIGMDVALEGGMLRGMKEWSVVKYQAPSGEAWPLFAQRLIESRLAQKQEKYTEEDVVAGLFDFVDEFLSDKQKMGLYNIHIEYFKR